ncbi:MAG: hypothetical protein ACOC9W_06220, partial [Persicimonas sp.]
VSKSGSAKERHFLRGFIEHLVMSASDSLDEWVSRKVVVVPAKTWSRKASFPKYERILPALSRRQAREQLTELVSALLAEPSFHLLPIEVAEELVEEADSLATLAAAHLRACELARENDTDGDYGGISTQYGPVANYLDYPPPDDPLATIARRFRYHPTLDRTLPEMGEQA